MSDLTTYIVFENDRRAARKPKAITWLLTDAAKWVMDAKKFMIVDDGLLKKVEGKMFAGASLERRLTARYPYLKTAFEQQRENEDTTNEGWGIPDEAPETTETETTNKEVDIEVLFNSIAVIKQYVDENDVDVSVLLEAEKEGKNRKSLIKYLTECQSN